jgi:hypothetical protein
MKDEGGAKEKAEGENGEALGAFIHQNQFIQSEGKSK